MNLQEQIYRIKGLMTEDRTSEIVKTLIDSQGILVAIKLMGGLRNIKPYLTKNDKVNYIKQTVSKYLDEFNSSGIGVSEFYDSPIYYKEENNELHQIEYFTKDYVYVDVYGDDGENHSGDYSERYEILPDEVLEEVFAFWIDHSDDEI